MICCRCEKQTIEREPYCDQCWDVVLLKLFSSENFAAVIQEIVEEEAEKLVEAGL